MVRQQQSTGCAEASQLESLASALAEVLPMLHSLERRVERDFPHPKPPQAQLAILRLVRECDAITVRAAAEALQMQANNVSALVSQLVTDGLLVREQDPVDRRVAHLHVTPQARERIEDFEHRVRGHVVTELQALDDDERTAVKHAVPALARLARRVRSNAH